MKDCTLFVGLDYHQAAVQVCAVNRGGQVLLNRRCRNDWRAIVKVVRPYGHVARVAIESCTGAANTK